MGRVKKALCAHERLDWEAQGREHARKVWDASTKLLGRIPHEPFAGVLEPVDETDKRQLRDGYRSELHLLALRYEVAIRAVQSDFTLETLTVRAAS
jgi:hypothetical protein